MLLALTACGRPAPVFHSCHLISTRDDPAPLGRWLGEFAMHHKIERGADGTYAGGRSGLRLVVEPAAGATRLVLYAPPDSCDGCHEQPHDLSATLAKSFETSVCAAQ
jgi:hypothetical protein